MGVFVENVEYDISLQRSTGEILGFMTVPHSDRRERINDYAPNISTTGDIAYAEGVWKPWTQDTWVSGLGEEVWSSAEQSRFYEAENVETRIDGKVMLATALTLTDASIATAQPVDFSAKVYMRCTATNLLREYTDGVGWASVGAGFLSSPTDMIVFGDKLYVASANTHYAWMEATGSWTVAPVDREHFATFNPGATPSLYGSHGHQVFASTDGSTWGTAISIGDSSADITAMAPFAQALYIGKEDGLYRYDGADVVQMIDARNRLWSGNFVGGLAEWEGFLYFSVLRRIFKFSESAVIDITPEAYGSLAAESYDYGLPEAFVTSPTALYVGFDLAENDYPCVLSYTGLGWHPIYKGASGATFEGMGYSAELDWFLVNDGNTHFRQLVSMTDYPYPIFCVGAGATGSLTTPKFDGGMPVTPKAVKSVTLSTRDCDANQKITVQYRKDGASAFTEVGDITSSPSEELSLSPLQGAVSVSDWIQFRFILSTVSPANTPVLEHMAINWLPRPPAVFAYSVSLRLGSPLTL